MFAKFNALKSFSQSLKSKEKVEKVVNQVDEDDLFGKVIAAEIRKVRLNFA